MFTGQRVEAQGGQTSPRWAGNTEQRSLPMRATTFTLAGASKHREKVNAFGPNTRQMQRIAMKAARQGKAPAKAVPEAETDTVGIEDQLLGASSLQHCFLRAGRQQARRETFLASPSAPGSMESSLAAIIDKHSIYMYIYIYLESADIAPARQKNPRLPLSNAKRRQTLTALSAPEAEVVALSEALAPSVDIHDACRDVGLAVGCSPEVLFVIKTDSQVTLTQLRNESVTARSIPFANRLNYACDMCHGPGTSQKADGLAKILGGASLKNFASDLGLTSLSHK